MLILSRRPGESLLISDDIEVVLLSADGKQVRLGIDTPRDLLVLREELAELAKDDAA